MAKISSNGEGGKMKNMLIVKLFRKASLSVSLCSCCEGVEALVRCPAPTDAADIYLAEAKEFVKL